jgi:hypothetical protein
VAPEDKVMVPEGQAVQEVELVVVENELAGHAEHGERPEALKLPAKHDSAGLVLPL